MSPTEPNIYDSAFVRDLFDEMSSTYGLINLITSFGFTYWWRRDCASAIQIQPNSHVLDLMSGMGELCTELSKKLNEKGTLAALDISPEMCNRARKHQLQTDYRVIEADALNPPLEDASFDYIFSTFGLKTFDDVGLAALAREVHQLLKPGGNFAFLEISVPPNPWLRAPYIFNLNVVIPILGKILLGNSDHYRMLGVYTEAFANCEKAALIFRQHGLAVEESSYFFGCATGINGNKNM
ncbi:MAG: class I SAM-dependent methyltransferase [Planctomycetota bacterium]